MSTYKKRRFLTGGLRHIYQLQVIPDLSGALNALGIRKD